MLKSFTVSVVSAFEKDDFSLFFTLQELHELALSKEHADQNKLKEKKLYLRALFYQSPQEWSVWLNDGKITPTQPHSSVRVQNITSQAVILEWTYKGQQHPVILQPNQSYDPETKKVREGQ